MANNNTRADTAANLGFHALSDATRRGVIAQLALGEAPISQLAEPYDMALPTFLKHVKVLEAGGLVSTRKVGRTRICKLEPDKLAKLSAWITEYEQGWRNRLNRLANLVDKGET